VDWEGKGLRCCATRGEVRQVKSRLRVVMNQLVGMRYEMRWNRDVRKSAAIFAGECVSY
jgi:hypothetical protein